MERPLITVIVLVYNAGDYLGPCLESISRQTMTDFELLLVDNGSTDGSGEACDAFALAEPRCRVIHQENLGIIGGRGAGVRAARGEYLAFVDSDDLLHRPAGGLLPLSALFGRAAPRGAGRAGPAAAL